MQGLHHIRKRRLEKPQGANNHETLDKFMYLVSVVAPFVTLPQLYLVWIKRDVSGLSVFSWIGYSFFNAIWVIYGLVHRDKPIVLCNIVWVIVQGFVVLGILLYR